MSDGTPQEVELERRLQELLVLDSKDLMQELARIQRSDPELFEKLRRYIEQMKKKRQPP